MSPRAATTARPVIDDDAPGAPPPFVTGAVSEIVERVAIAKIGPSPLNPRKHFGHLDELAANIRAQGIISPLVVRPVDHDEAPFEIVDGERRYRAALAAGLTELPVLVRAKTDAEVMEIQILSAIQRQDLTPLEEARGYRRLIAEHPSKYSAAYLADRISRSERYVVDRMRLLELVPALQQLLDDERIGVGHAELLAKLKPEDQQRAIAVWELGISGTGALYHLRKLEARKAVTRAANTVDWQRT